MRKIPTKQPQRRLRTRLYLVAFVVMSLLITWQTARPVQAQFVSPWLMATIVEDIPQKTESAIRRAYEAVKSKIKIATDIAFKNGAQTFLATTVQQFATALATTQPGQQPLFLTNPTTFFTDVENAAAGQFIDDFTRGLTGASFNQRGELVGGTTGPTGSSSSRQRFIISRLLKAGVDATGAQCQDNCQVTEGVSRPARTNLAYLTFSNFSDVLGENDAQRGVNLLSSQLTQKLVTGNKDTPNESVVCAHVTALATPGQDLWAFQFNNCVGANIPDTCTMTYRQCFLRVSQSLNSLKHDAGEMVKQCLSACRTGIAGSARAAVSDATATDVFDAIENFDIRTSPAAIASRLSSDKSDLGQFIQASALLTATVQDKVLGEKTNLDAGLLPRTTKVSQTVITPKEGASALFGVPFYNNDGQLTYTGTGAADILRGLASFINSPVGKALTVYFRSRCGLNPNTCKGPSNPESEVGRLLFGSSGQSGIAAAKIQLATLGKVDIISGNPGKDQVDIVSQLTSGGLIDSRFGQAIDEHLTVQQAIDRGLLDGNRTFGFDNNGLEPQDGYPFRSLQYLRKYRVTPVGWELAAQYAKQFSSQNLSLNYLIEQYGMCAQNGEAKVCSTSLKSCTATTDCQSGDQDGGTCGASPYCGLVDPDWVLKAPQTYCRRQGAGEDIITKEFVCDDNNVNKVTGETIKTNNVPEEDDGAPNCVYDSETNPHPDLGHWVIARDTNTCADAQSCIAEKDDGSCLAYGYCVQEKDTFKFNGTQCDVQNATCTTYTTTAGQDVSYLANTVDTTTCSPGSAGCQWYCQQPNFDETTKQWTCSETAGSKIYFTGKAKTCNAGDVGCQQFIKIGPGANVLPNGGFEIYEGGNVNGNPAPASFTGWQSGAISMLPIAASDSENTIQNTVAVGVNAQDAAETISQTVQLGSSLEERVFTASVRMKSDNACTARLQLCLGGTCSGSPLAPTAEASVSTNWGTGGVQIAIPTKAELPTTETRLTFSIQLNDCRTAGLVIDSAQLEEVAGLSSYKDYGTTGVISLNGKRQQCTMADVGCEAYTPKNGGSIVNAIVTPSNRCSDDSVGCQVFQRKPITTLPYRDYNPAAPSSVGPDVTIVAPKGKQCTAADVGCEEYTNLDTVAQGGEGKEYFTSVKQCARPSNTAVTKTTYYTWMGDAQRGLQLHSVTLVQSNLGDGPCTNLGVGTTTTDPSCADNGQTLSAGLCSAAEMATNPDCTQYYDQNLNVYYILKSKTVSVTDDCHPYRNTIDQTDAAYADNRERVYYLARGENRTCTATAASCRAFSGTTGAASRTVFSNTFERTSSSGWTGGFISTASTQAAGHSMLIQANGTSGVAFTSIDAMKNVVKKGKTYLLKFTGASAQDGASPAIRAFFDTGNDTSGSFGTAFGVPFQTSAGVTARWNNAITPSGPEWQQYTLGPVTIKNDPPADWRLGITVTGGPAYVDNVTLVEVRDTQYLINNSAPQCAASEVGCTAYTARDNSTVNVTSFSRLCNQEVVGCAAVIDTQNSDSPFEQTVKGVTTPADAIKAVVNDPGVYCKSSANGCEKFGLPQYIQDNTLKSFSTVYLINDPDQHNDILCLANENACRQYTIAGGATVVMKDPGTGTCTYVTNRTGSGAWYITGTTIPCATRAPENIQPVGASCSPVCVGGSRAGKACGVPSTDQTLNAVQCPPDKNGQQGVCTGDLRTAGRINDGNGNTVIGSCSASSQCQGGNACVYQVGVCPEEQNSCTLYRDPSSPTACQTNCSLQLQGGSPIYVDASCTKTVCRSQSGTPGPFEGQNCQTSQQCGAGSICVGTNTSVPTTGAPGCRAYTYLKNTLMDDAGSCDGVVDLKQGCLPFNDTSLGALNFRGQ